MNFLTCEPAFPRAEALQWNILVSLSFSSLILFLSLFLSFFPLFIIFFSSFYPLLFLLLSSYIPLLSCSFPLFILFWSLSYASLLLLLSFWLIVCIHVAVSLAYDILCGTEFFSIWIGNCLCNIASLPHCHCIIACASFGMQHLAHSLSGEKTCSGTSRSNHGWTHHRVQSLSRKYGSFKPIQTWAIGARFQHGVEV